MVRKYAVEDRVDPREESVIPLAELTGIVQSDVGYNTVLNWIKRGRINHFTKERIHLEAVRMPYGWGTSVEAYWRFVEKLNSC